MPFSDDETELIASAPLLSAIGRDLRETFIGKLAVVDVAKREILFHEDDKATAFYFVLSGWIRLYRMDPSGKRADIALFGRGDSFGEAAMFLGGEFPVSAQAAEEARLARMSAADLEALLKQSPGLCFALLGSLSLHLRRLVEQVSRDRILTGEQRLCTYLLGVCEEARGPTTARLPYEKHILAGMLGIAPEALSRAFAELRSSGVRVRGREITIRDPKALRKLI